MLRLCSQSGEARENRSNENALHSIKVNQITTTKSLNAIKKIQYYKPIKFRLGIILLPFFPSTAKFILCGNILRLTIFVRTNSYAIGMGGMEYFSPAAVSFMTTWMRIAFGNLRERNCLDSRYTLNNSCAMCMYLLYTAFSVSIYWHPWCLTGAAWLESAGFSGMPNQNLSVYKSGSIILFGMNVAIVTIGRSQIKCYRMRQMIKYITHSIFHLNVCCFVCAVNLSLSLCVSVCDIPSLYLSLLLPTILRLHLLFWLVS